ncbi:MAG: SPOR domain-containing protein [Spirochaetales bacterium]
MKNSKGMIFLLAGLASLTLIIAVAYFFFSRDQGAAKQIPATTATTLAPATTALPDAFDPVEWSRNPQASPTTGLATTETDKTSPTTDTPNGGFVVTMPEENPATGTSTAKPQAKSPAESLQSSGTVAFPETVAKTPVTKPAVKAPAAKTPPKVTKATKTVTVTEYWLQVGAFKDRYQAEAVSKTLENQGLKGTLSTVTVSGVTVVRVRVGPYANQDEAKKFLAWVVPVKGLEESYITATKATRTE